MGGWALGWVDDGAYGVGHACYFYFFWGMDEGGFSGINGDRIRSVYMLITRKVEDRIESSEQVVTQLLPAQRLI